MSKQQALSHALRYAYTLGSRHFGDRNRRGTDNAADYAAHLAARDTARNAAHDAARSHYWRRRLFFLNHLDFFRNLGRCAQLPVHDVGLDLS